LASEAAAAPKITTQRLSEWKLQKYAKSSRAVESAQRRKAKENINKVLHRGKNANK